MSENSGEQNINDEVSTFEERMGNYASDSDEEVERNTIGRGLCIGTTVMTTLVMILKGKRL